jgi:CIC family chloride channel protein
VMALVSVLFIRSLYGAEDLFERWIPKRDYLRHVSGMLVVGAIAESLMLARGHYYVQGVGYATILDILSGTLTGIGFLVALFALKLVVTSMTLGSGASGGVFSPSLFMGATLGGAYGLTLRALLPGLHIDPTALALAGMAGLVAGTTGAALTAIVMIFEMTLDYSVVLPMTLTVAVSYGLRRALFAESVYTMKLARRGHPMPWALQANAHLVHHVTDMVIDAATVVPASTPGRDLVLDAGDDAPARIVLMQGSRVVGVLPRAWALGHRDAICAAGTLADVAQHDFVTIASTAAIFEVLARLQFAHASVAVVLQAATREHDAVLGIVTKAHLAEAIAEGLELFGD